MNGQLTARLVAKAEEGGERMELAALQEPADRMMAIVEVTARIGLSRATVYRMMEAGTFPHPLRLSERTIRWRESEIARWIDAADLQRRVKKRV